MAGTGGGGRKGTRTRGRVLNGGVGCGGGEGRGKGGRQEQSGRVSGTSPIIDRQIEARTHHVGAASSVTRGRGDGELVMLFFCVRVEKKKSRPVFFILQKIVGGICNHCAEALRKDRIINNGNNYFCDWESKQFLQKQIS